MSDCGRYAVFIGTKTNSANHKCLSMYVRNFDILQEPKEHLFESSIVRYGRDGHYCELNSFSNSMKYVTKKNHEYFVSIL